MLKKILIFSALICTSTAINAKDICVKKSLYGVDSSENNEFIKVINIKPMKKFGSIVTITGTHFIPNDATTKVYPFTGAAYVMPDGTITFSYRGIVVEGATNQLTGGNDHQSGSFDQNIYSPIDCKMLPTI